MAHRKRLSDRLSIVIPTPGQGRPLARTLRSINHQRRPGDEIIVVHDAIDGRDPEVFKLCEWYGARYVECAFDAHSWGHKEIQHGYAHATGDFIAGCDDDDVFTPDAFTAIRDRIAELREPRPLMFQFMTPWRVVLWEEPAVVENRIGGHCLVFPNIPERIGRWTERYNGDYDFIRSTIDLWPNKDADIVWCPNLIAWTRPTPEEEAWLIPDPLKVAV